MKLKLYQPPQRSDVQHRGFLAPVPAIFRLIYASYNSKLIAMDRMSLVPQLKHGKRWNVPFGEELVYDRMHTEVFSFVLPGLTHLPVRICLFVLQQTLPPNHLLPPAPSIHPRRNNLKHLWFVSVFAIPSIENASICSEEAFLALKCQPDDFKAMVATFVFRIAVN